MHNGQRPVVCTSEHELACEAAADRKDDCMAAMVLMFLSSRPNIGQAASELPLKGGGEPFPVSDLRATNGKTTTTTTSSFTSKQQQQQQPEANGKPSGKGEFLFAR